MRFLKKVVGRGNVTLPSEIREAMDIQNGDIIEFQVVGIVRRGKEPKTISNDTQTGVPN